MDNDIIAQNIANQLNSQRLLDTSLNIFERETGRSPLLRSPQAATVRRQLEFIEVPEDAFAPEEPITEIVHADESYDQFVHEYTNPFGDPRTNSSGLNDYEDGLSGQHELNFEGGLYTEDDNLNVSFPTDWAPTQKYHELNENIYENDADENGNK